MFDGFSAERLSLDEGIEIHLRVGGGRTTTVVAARLSANPCHVAQNRSLSGQTVYGGRNRPAWLR